jgi:hypothetical protein
VSQWSGTQIVIGRMLGQVDQDDPTNLPLGCASTCKNTDFTRDSTGSSLAATTRAGNCLTAQGLPSPGTGLWDFQYEPESATDPFFQQLLRFSLTGTLERENPPGTGRMIPVPAGMFALPANCHKIDTQTANVVFSAYSSALFNPTPLKTPASGLSCYNPKTLTMDPLGMKPFGFYWVPATYVYAGEVVCPSIQNSGQQGNGHTYQAQNSGWTSLTTEPVWPLIEGSKGGTVVETNVGPGNTPVTWKELTMVIANRIPAPPAPVGMTLAGGGTFAAARSVYILLTFTNGMGETIAGPASFITTTASGQAVNVPIPTLASLAGWLSQLGAPYAITGANVYEADVAVGQPAPPQSGFGLVGSFALGSTATVDGTASGAEPPTINSARITPGQLPTPTAEPVIARTTAGSTVNPPGAADLSLVNAGGTFPNNQTVYILLTLTNTAGETTAGEIVGVTTTAVNQGVRVSLASNYGPTVTGVNIYEADVAAGSSPPVSTAFQLVGSFALGADPVVTATASGAAPPLANTADLPTGAFPAGRDIYVALTYSNAAGETPLGPSNSIIDTLANDAVQVTLSAVPEYPQITTVNIYEADVPTGATPPPNTAFAKVGSFQVPVVEFILETATGSNPPLVNGTGPAGNIAADTTTGGINGTQGYRYGVPAWMNRNETISGFTPAAVSKSIIDEDGWEVSVFNVALGPVNIIGRVINWTEADGTQDGPFAWIGLVNLQVPTQNQVYPKSFLSDGITIIPTVFLDNVTTSGTFNFTDEFLSGELVSGAGGNDTTDRLTLMAPPQAVRVDFLLTVNRICLSGVPGLTSGHVISKAADYESFDQATGPLPISTDSGEIAWGVLEYRNQIYSMRERSGVVLTPGTGEPSSWDAKARWSGDKGNGVGPCGPRAFAQNGQFIGFVHRTGFYRYDDTTPDIMTKEIPREWGTINWAAATTISLSIDDDTHTVRIQVPTGNSMVPNKEFCLSYLEGWMNPIHFTTYSQKEVTQEASRRWSFNDVSAYISKRIYRTIPNPPPMPLGDTGVQQTGSGFYISQLAYTTCDQSGIINARTPGRFDDNGAGIDWVYETTSAQAMQKVSKPEGLVTSAVGQGPINVTFIAGRRRLNDSSGAKRVLKCAPIPVTPNGSVDFTSRPDRATDEYWRVRYDNGKQPGVWCSLKKALIYVIPTRQARAAR